MESIEFSEEEKQEVVKMLKVVIGIRQDEEIIEFLDAVGIEVLSDRDYFIETITGVIEKICKLADIFHEARRNDKKV